MTSQALQILVPEGNPNGIKIIDLANWSGKCFIVSRQSLKELKSRPEINQPALYLLFGVDHEASELVYIGESENFYSRVSEHDSQKDFWDVAVIFTGGINRAGVKYLEYKATTLAQAAGRMKVQNKVSPRENSLSEFDKNAMETYFENVKFILGVMGYEVFETVAQSVSDTTLYHLRGEGFDATAQLLADGSMNVIKGSLARIRETDSFANWARLMREKFLKDGTLVDAGNGTSYAYTKDAVFKTPSTAADTVTGRSTNGWTAWKDGEGKTLDENLRK